MKSTSIDSAPSSTNFTNSSMRNNAYHRRNMCQSREEGSRAPGLLGAMLLLSTLFVVGISLGPSSSTISTMAQDTAASSPATPEPVGKSTDEEANSPQRMSSDPEWTEEKKEKAEYANTTMDVSTETAVRSKRQWGCPNGCFSSCMNSAQCQRYQLATVCVLGCCCPAQTQATNLSAACDGDAAVAACLNGLCGQGYFCNTRNFCCRCQSGTSPGPCVNNLCPPGYACNTNNFCCSLGAGFVLGPCVNGQCPPGYACGAGNLCYPVTGGTPPLAPTLPGIPPMG